MVRYVPESNAYTIELLPLSSLYKEMDTKMSYASVSESVEQQDLRNKELDKGNTYLVSMRSVGYQSCH